MEELNSLEQAALDHATKRFPTSTGEGTVTDWTKESSFRKGAEWRSHQFKQLLLNILNTQINIYNKIGDLDWPAIKEAKQFIESYNKTT